MPSHADAIQQQFDSQAQAYLASAVHAGGPDLVEAGEWLASLGANSGLDVGTGAGHLAFLMASHLRRVVASDPSAGMLATVAAVARERGHHQLTTCLASGEALPFADGEFDVVATRYSAHHWLDLERALGEMYRVLAPGGTAIVVDLLGEDDPLADTHLQAMEVLRDPSHVRNRSVREWTSLLTGAGFEVQQQSRHAVRLDFTAWVARMRTPSQTVAAIRRLQQGAPSQVADRLAFEPDGTFTVRTGTFRATRG